MIGKTEGNGGVNDFTRILADQAFRGVLLEHGTRSADEVGQIPMVWSGGTDGVLTPHATVFARVPDGGEPGPEPRLTVGVAMSDVILPEHIGRPEMVATVAEGVRRAMADAGIDDPAEVHYVQTKTPLLTMATIERGPGPGRRHGHRRAAGVDEPVQRHHRARHRGGARRDRRPRRPARSATTCRCTRAWRRARRVSSWTGPRSSWSATPPASGGRYRIGHSVMRDALDAEGVYDADPLRRARPARAAAWPPTWAGGW